MSGFVQFVIGVLLLVWLAVANVAGFFLDLWDTIRGRRKP